MAILSLMARIGSSDPVELRTNHAELVDGFDISRFGSAPTKLDIEDLVPMTARSVQALPASAVADVLRRADVPDEMQETYWDTVRGNTDTRAEAGDWWPIFSGSVEPVVADEDRDFLRAALGLLGDPPYASDTWSVWTAAVKEATGRKGKSLFMPLRHALTGKSRGPEMADIMPLLQQKPRID